jgi:hypothetical protein
VRGVAREQHSARAEAPRHAVIEREAGHVLGIRDLRPTGHVPVDHALGGGRLGPLAGAVVAEEQAQAPAGQRHRPEPLAVEEHGVSPGSYGQPSTAASISALDHGVEMLLEQDLQLALAERHRSRERAATPPKPRRATCRPPEKSPTPVIGSDAATIASATPV